MRVLSLRLNGRERIVQCPHCCHREVYAKPHRDSFIQNHFEKVLMKNIRSEIKREHKVAYAVRKMIRIVFKLDT